MHAAATERLRDDDDVWAVLSEEMAGRAGPSEVLQRIAAGVAPAPAPWRPVAALGLLVGCYAAALAVLGALGVAAWHVVEGGGGVLGDAALALLVVAAGLTVVVARVLRRPLPVVEHRDLSAAAHPGLWAEITDVADRIGVDVPDRVSLVAAPVLALRENAGRLGLVTGERHLELGVPLLLTLTRGQLRALVATELALRRGGPAGVVHRGHLTLTGLAARESDTLLVGRLLGLASRVYRRVGGPVTLRHAVAADQVAASIAGTRAVIGALRRLPTVQAAWALYLDEHATVVPDLRPRALFEGFAELWADAGVQARLGAVHDPRFHVERRVTALLGRRTPLHEPRPTELDESPARQVVKRLGLHALDLEAALHRGDARRPASWEEIADRAARADVAARTARVTARLETCVMDLSPARARTLLADHLAPGASEREVRTRAVALVAAGIEAGLLHAGRARVVPCWASTWLLVDDAGRSVDPVPEVEAAWASPAGQARLLGTLREHGVAHLVPADLGSPAGPLAPPPVRR